MTLTSFEARERSSPEANWARSLGLRPSSVYIFAESGAAKTAGTLVPTANPILLPRIGHDDSVQAGPAQSFVRIFIGLSRYDGEANAE